MLRTCWLLCTCVPIKSSRVARYYEDLRSSGRWVEGEFDRMGYDGALPMLCATGEGSLTK